MSKILKVIFGFSLLVTTQNHAADSTKQIKPTTQNKSIKKLVIFRCPQCFIEIAADNNTDTVDLYIKHVKKCLERYKNKS